MNKMAQYYADYGHLPSRTQQNALPPQPQNSDCCATAANLLAFNQLPIATGWHIVQREMTHADLGLPLVQWDWEWLTEMYGDGASHRRWFDENPKTFVLGRWTDAPYAFWLGADA